MIEHLRFRRELAKRRRQEEHLRAFCKAEISKARSEGKSRSEIGGLEAQEHAEVTMLEEEIAIVVTEHWLRKAHRRFVPTPELKDGDMWIQCSRTSNEYVLTNRGISQLRTSLRRELKERVEVVVMAAAIVTGLLGALTGLVAVVLR